MQNKEIFEKFKELSKEGCNDKKFNVINLANTKHKLGVSKEGYPKFFICTSDKSSSTPNRVLDKLTVEYNLSCTFIDDNASDEVNYYSVVSLTSSDVLLQEDFIDIMLLIIQRLGELPSKRQISIEVENLISIFSAMALPPKKKLQGIWTELLIIERSLYPEILINAWHEDPKAKYDFTYGRDKLEVKSTQSEVRKHHFSLDQITPSTHSNVLVASAIVRESAHGNGGLSVHDLIDRVNARININARMRVFKIVADTIGSDLQRYNNTCFDYIGACDTLKFYDAKDIPGIDKQGIQPGVSAVGFDSVLVEDQDVQNSNALAYWVNSPLYKSIF